MISPHSFSGPVVILQRSSLGAAVEKMIRYTKRYIPENARIIHLVRGKQQILFLDEIRPPVTVNRFKVQRFKVQDWWRFTKER